MQKAEKEALLGAFAEDIHDAKAVILVEFRGLHVPEVTDLRHKLRQEKISYKVIKNTLAKRAIAGSGMEVLADALTGPTAWIYSAIDPIAMAKIVTGFLADIPKERLTIKRGYLEGKALSAAEVVALSKLPGMQELRAQLLALMTATASKLLRVLSARPAEFLAVLKARQNDLEPS